MAEWIGPLTRGNDRNISIGNDPVPVTDYVDSNGDTACSLRKVSDPMPERVILQVVPGPKQRPLQMCQCPDQPAAAPGERVKTWYCDNGALTREMECPHDPPHVGTGDPQLDRLIEHLCRAGMPECIHAYRLEDC
jgi:hypothetical protein